MGARRGTSGLTRAGSPGCTAERPSPSQPELRRGRPLPAAARAQWPPSRPHSQCVCAQVSAPPRHAPPTCPPARPGHLPRKLVQIVALGSLRGGTRRPAMEVTSGTREPRTRPRDPDRHPRPDRDRHPERQQDRHPERPRDRAGDRRREKRGGERRDGERDRDRGRDRDQGRDRDPHQDRRRVGDSRPGEQRVLEKPRQSRTRDGPRRPTWDAAPPPWPAPWETPESPPYRKEGTGHRGPER